MKVLPKPRVKICCINSVHEAHLAVRYGAAALGLVSEMPSGPGVISEAEIAQIAAAAPPAVGTFLLTSRQDTAAIIAQQRRCRVNTIQICDRLETGTYDELRAALPGISIIQVIHVTGPESIDEALAIAPHVHGLLLDSGNQSLAVKELGGTGRVHDWRLSRTICELAEKPVFLAGGLSPDNVCDAIEQVRPYGLDLCSSVRTNGQLDEHKLALFFKKVNSYVEG